jgi:hypothetical protein
MDSQTNDRPQRQSYPYLEATPAHETVSATGEEVPAMVMRWVYRTGDPVTWRRRGRYPVDVARTDMEARN